jgi:hypothetical protein
METFLFLLKCLGGVMLFFLISYLLGKLLKLDKHIYDQEKDKTKTK